MAVPLEYTPKGITDLVVTCGGEAVSVDWLRFKNRPKYFTEVGRNADPAQPDDQGFIRRWRLMEPIAIDVRSNIVFTMVRGYAKNLPKNWFVCLSRKGNGTSLTAKITT